MKSPSFKSLLLAIVCGIMVLLLFAVLVVNVWQKRVYLDEQLRVVSQDAASSLGLSLSTIAEHKDWVIAAAMVDAIFDSGAYLSIKLAKPQGELILERNLEFSLEGVPAWFVRALPITTPEAQAQVVAGWNQAAVLTIISHPGAAYRDLWRNVQLQLALFAGFGLLALLLLSALLRQLTNPLTQLELAAAKVAGKDFGIQLAVPATRELRRVTEAVNAMAEALQRTFTEQLMTIETLRQHAFNDALTGLLNRQAFDERLQICLADEREGQGLLLTADLPLLASYNNQFGAERVDSYIKALADAMASALENHSEGFAGRIGVGSLAIYVPVCEPDSAERLAQLVAAKCRNIGALGSATLVMPSISLMFAGNQRTVGQLFAALHSYPGSLSLPGNTSDTQPWQWHSEYLHQGQQLLTVERQWQELLSGALWQDGLVLFFQPVVTFQPAETPLHSSILFKQVLARLQLNNNTLAAADFIAHAERLGFAFTLDILVTEKVLSILAAAPDQHNAVVVLAASSLQHAEFGERLRKLLSRYARDCRRLLFNVPGWAVANGKAGFGQLLQLRNQFGFRIVVSRLGVTKDSLQLLEDYRMDVIQLDAALTYRLNSDQGRKVYLRSIVQLAHGRGVQVIASGVERLADWRSLAGSGVDGVTGFFIARPNPFPGPAPLV